jgi:hypothetical protein
LLLKFAGETGVQVWVTPVEPQLATDPRSRPAVIRRERTKDEDNIV